MKKTALLLMLLLSGQFCKAVLITSTDNLDGTCLVELNTVAGEENIAAMALEVDCFEGDITAIDITSYNPLMNIYPDYAHDEEISGDGYQRGEGHPICLDNTIGAVPLPLSDFTINAGTLAEPDFYGYATVRFLLSANENVSARIQENLTRGGLIGINGTPLDIETQQLNFTITIPEPATLLLVGIGAVMIRKR